MVLQRSTEGQDLFQGNFANNNTYDWRDLWQFTTTIKKAELDGNLRLICAIAVKVDAVMI